MICMAAPFPSSSRMDAWPQRRGLQTVSIICIPVGEKFLNCVTFLEDKAV